MAHPQLSGNFMRPDLNGNQDGTHGGSIAMVLVLAIAFLAVAAGFVTVGRANSAPYILALLAVFAMSGVFLLFAVASGVLTISDKGSANALLKSVVDSARDGAGLPAPGSLAVRTLAAAWLPPEEAWSRASASDSGLIVRWSEDQAEWTMRVGADGLPIALERVAEGSAALRLSYLAWREVAGVRWPARAALEGERGALRLEWRVTRVSFAVQPPSRLWIVPPPGLERWTLERVLELFGSGEARDG
jgi:hypothetical protein